MAEEQILEQHLEAKKLIEKIMEKDIRSRNDDKWLCFQVWREQGINLFIPFQDFERMFNPETIIRNRASIQNDEGRLLPTDPMVLIKRKVKEKVLRQFYANNQKIIDEWETLKYEVK